MLWIIVLGVGSLALCKLAPRFSVIGVAAAAFLLIDHTAHFNRTLWLVFVLAVVVLLGLAIPPEMTAKLFARAGSLPFAAIMGAILFGAATAGVGTAATQMVALPLPGGDVQNVAVQSAYVVDDNIELASEPRKVTYDAYDAEPGTHQFGKSVTFDSAQAGAQHFYEKSARDRLFTATMVHFFKYGEGFDPAAAEAEAATYVKDPAKWDAAIKWLHDQAEAFYVVDAGDIQYASLGMVTTGTDRTVMPKLTKFSDQPALKQTLVVKQKDGSSRTLRGLCDLQPSVVKDFPKVPEAKKPEVPPTKPPTTVTTPPSTDTTPPTSTTTVETTTTPSTETTTTTPETSTTTTTPETSTTTTTEETTTTTTTPETSTTTTTTPPVTTTTEKPKDPTDDVPGPTGAPSPPSDVETTDPVESDPQGTVEQPNNEAPEVPDDGATPTPTTTEPSTPQPGAPTDGTGIDNPDGGGAAMLIIPALLGGAILRRRLISKETAE